MSTDELRILVVDDSPTASLYLKAKLQSLVSAAFCATVDACTTGEEALSLHRDKPFDLMVLDVVLPGIDGFEICRTVKQESSTRIAFLTGLNDEKSMAKAEDAGCDHYIVKPASEEVLLDIVKITSIKCNRGIVVNA